MSASAKVTVQLEIESTAAWSDKCTVGQVREQAMAAIKSELRRLAELSRYDMRLVGDPTVQVVAFDANYRSKP